MELKLIIDYLIISIIASIAINSVLRNFAKSRKILIDSPDRSRKFHDRSTPVTGGLGILIALLISGKLYIDLNDLNGYMPNFSYHLMISSIFLVFAFLFDDYKGLNKYKRLIIQALISLYMIFFTGTSLENLGDLFGFGNITLGVMSIPFTIFCSIGIMNAFNMIDGINGLCSGYAMIGLLFMGFFSGLIYDSLLIIFIGSIIGFLLFNLSFLGQNREVFLGDHGSNLIGFWVAWCAIYCSQNELYSFEPITAIWIVAIPLLDCIGLIFSRYRKNINWALPGRTHIHHKLMNRFSSNTTLVIIISVGLITNFFAIYMGNNYPAWVSTILFIMYGSHYYVFSYYVKK